jgi:multimeric flavodoxin WrbA
LLDADAIIVGSPVYNANVTPQVSEFLANWPFESAPMKNKIGTAYATGGGISASEELTQLSILHSMLIFRIIIVAGPMLRNPSAPRQLPTSRHFLQKEMARYMSNLFAKARHGKAGCGGGGRV